MVSHQSNIENQESDTISQAPSNFTNVTIKTTQLPMNLDTEFLLIDLREP